MYNICIYKEENTVRYIQKETQAQKEGDRERQTETNASLDLSDQICMYVHMDFHV